MCVSAVFARWQRSKSGEARTMCAASPFWPTPDCGARHFNRGAALCADTARNARPPPRQRRLGIQGIQGLRVRQRPRGGAGARRADPDPAACARQPFTPGCIVIWQASVQDIAEQQGRDCKGNCNGEHVRVDRPGAGRDGAQRVAGDRGIVVGDGVRMVRFLLVRPSGEHHQRPILLGRQRDHGFHLRPGGIRGRALRCGPSALWCSAVSAIWWAASTRFLSR